MPSQTLQNLRLFGGLALSLCMTISCVAQNTSPNAAQPPVEQSLRELREQIRELQSSVAEMRTETTRYREEARELRREVGTLKPTSNSPTSEGSPYETASTGPTQDASHSEKETFPDSSSIVAESNSPNLATTAQDRVAKLEEEYQLLSGKVDDQYQTKIESASKYRVRLSGIVLLNLFGDKGSVDNLDTPELAIPAQPGASSGSVGATLRQSQLGLEVFGPRIAGARTTADMQLDFAGGFTNTWNGVNSGIVRLRTATLRLDWAKTSLVAGQDELFFSPRAPTSFASLAIPALSYAGNLWSWTPQIHLEHRFTLSETSSLLVQGGILDNLTGDAPADSYSRSPHAGELSRQPAYASRAAWSQKVFGQKMTIAGAGYFSRQNYNFGRNVNGWAGMSDWNLPLGSRLSFSGKFYRGRALGGFGSAIGRSVVFNGDPSLPATSVIPLNVMGGWSQFKFKPKTTLEFNVAVGQDSAFSSDVRAGFLPYQSFYANIIRTRGSLANIIFRPRSDLLFSAEYRHLNSLALFDEHHSANQVNLIMGVLF